MGICNFFVSPTAVKVTEKKATEKIEAGRKQDFRVSTGEHQQPVETVA